MAHLIMFFIFYMIVITCQNFNLPQMYFIFAENFQISHMIFKHVSYYVK
jgi:hypothetical protein